MKANKKHLINQIESILADGICGMEEIDVTSEKLIKLIWPFFEYEEHQNKELIGTIKKRDDLLVQLLSEILKQDMLSTIGRLQEMIKKSTQNHKK